ncbi:hypothetical protein HDU79_005301 [Rhizoclosmatium sp. JEL0117]|nr:hypothetical protein HDU79_005301 [Rhizoclosmatium sp. JEL0117]
MSTFLTLQQAPNAGAITASLYLDQTFVGIHLNEVFSLSVSLNPVGTICSVITNVGKAVDLCPSAMGLMAGTRCFSVACSGDPNIIKASASYAATARFTSCPASNPKCWFADTASSKSTVLSPPGPAPVSPPVIAPSPDPAPAPPAQDPAPAQNPADQSSSPVPAPVDQPAANPVPSPPPVVGTTVSPQAITTQAPSAPIKAPSSPQQPTPPENNAPSAPGGNNTIAIGLSVVGSLVVIAAAGLVYTRYRRNSENDDIELAMSPVTHDSKTPGKRKALPIPKTERTADGKFTVPGQGVPAPVIILPRAGSVEKGWRGMPTNSRLENAGGERKMQKPVVLERMKDGYFAPSSPGSQPAPVQPINSQPSNLREAPKKVNRAPRSVKPSEGQRK